MSWKNLYRHGCFLHRNQPKLPGHASGVKTTTPVLEGTNNACPRRNVLVLEGTTGWRLNGKDPRDSHVKVAGRFCRIAYQMVAGGMTYRHPCGQQRDYIIQKLIKFAMDHVNRI